MKRLFIVLSLAMLAFSFQASAATFSLLNNTTGVTDNGDIVVNSEKIGTGSTAAFATKWTLGAASDATGRVVITANPNTGNNAITFALDVLVNGISVMSFASNTLDKVFNLSFLATDVVEFVVNGMVKKGSIDISVSSVPVPAAVWLFGSALMGLLGTTRRKPA
jgi:hypothetical protein